MCFLAEISAVCLPNPTVGMVPRKEVSLWLLLPGISSYFDPYMLVTCDLHLHFNVGAHSVVCPLFIHVRVSASHGG